MESGGKPTALQKLMNQELLPKTNLSHYRIVSKIGAGGMGEVWLAEDTRLDRQVALKLLPAEFTQDAERVRRFMQEAKAASALNHPNIISVYDIGESDAGRFIVMELVAGRTLRAVIAEDNSLEIFLTLSNQMAKAFSSAHAAGITHRDIKPDNIMVRDDGYVKVLDFGLARLSPLQNADFGLRNESAETLVQSPDSNPQSEIRIPQLTLPGTIMGTVAYMSPEQARGESVSHSSDVFALGIVFYELATGRHPFKAESLVGYLHAITLQTPAPPQQWQPNLPAVLNDLLLRMLDKEASRRPTASEVAQQLQAIERHSEQRIEHKSEDQTLMLGESPAFAHTMPPRHTVGREPERNELRTAFAQASTGHGSLLCVAGEPGIGKTTLVEDFLAELTAEGQCTIARGRCSERLAGTEAYLPLLEALENLLVRSPAFRRNELVARDIPPEGGTTNLMKQLAPTWYAQVVPLSGDSEESARLLAEVKAASQERMKRELASFLTAVAQAQPLVIFFDDLHWADVSTIDLLNFLASKFATMRVLIVVTYRPSDMLLAKHPFLQIRPDLQARGLCRELLLEFLTEAEIAEYLALEFPDNRFPPEFPQLIHAKTEGSPLFMADLVRYLRDRNVIAQTSGAWALEQTLPDIERELPESVRGMIERKIAQLSEDDRKLLTAASVQGYEFDSAIVAQVLNLEADEIEERLEKLERVFAFVKLMSEAEFPNGALTLKYRFVHVLYQNALYASLRATRKATLSRDVALALEACYGARSANVANELALLWEAARDYARASDSFLQAAHHATQGNTHQEAVQLARRGLEALRKLPETPERNQRELGLQLTLGFSLQDVQSWVAPEAGTAFNRAQQLCEQMGGDPRLLAALGGVEIYHLLRAEYETAQGLCEQMRQLAEQTQESVPLVVASVLGGVIHYFRGAVLAARQQFEYALALDRREYHEAYLAISNENLGTKARRDHSQCLWHLGYADQALALVHEAVTLAEQAAHPFSLSGAYLAAGLSYLLLRDWPSSQRQNEKVFALAEQYVLGDVLNYAKTNHAMALAYQEPTEAAIERAKQALASLRANGVTMAITQSLVMLGEVFGKAGRYAEGLETIAEALALVEHTGERFWEAELWRIKGELLLQAAASNSQASRAQAEAEGCYHQALEIARRQSAKAWELRAATSLARLWQQQGKTAEARQMLAEIYGWFTEGFDTADLKQAKELLDELSK